MKQLIPALALGLSLSAGVLADDDTKGNAAQSSPAVETLKSSLASTNGFEVEDVREGSDGASCITYRVANHLNGSNRVRAVVKGDKVLRESTGNTRFAKAWNSSCVNKSG